MKFLSIDSLLPRVVRDVCARKPEQRGRDLLLILDKMVKRWKGDGGEETLVMTLAMDGIAHLCRAGLIDIRTTLKVCHKCKCLEKANFGGIFFNNLS